MNNNILSLFKTLKKMNARLYLEEGTLKLDIEEGGLSPEIANDIKSNKQEIIDYLSRQEGVSYSKIEKVEKKSAYPLSPSQYRLWIQSQMEKESSSYNIPEYLFLDSSYDIDNLKKAIWGVIERHEILRTTFKSDDLGNAQQYIVDSSEFNFEIGYEDFRSEETPKQSAMEYIQNDSFKSFDLEKGPLLRVCLLQINTSEYVLYYNMHHIISDGWSMSVLSRDILAYYNHLTNEEPLNLPELSIQYKDYAEWQLKELESDNYKKYKTYWLNKLSGDLPLLDLPTNKQRPPIRTYNGERLSLSLSKDDSDAIKGFVKEKGGTLFMFLLSSLKTLFFKYTGQDDMLVGSPIAGRGDSELENQIGFYINTLVLRSSLNAEMSFDDFFEQQKQTLIEAYSNQYYPFDQLLGELNVKREASRNVLFDVIVEMQNIVEGNESPSPNIEKIGTVQDEGIAMAKLDATFTFSEQGNHIGLDLNYNTDVYDKEMMKKVLEHYQVLVQKIIAESHKSLGSLEYLLDTEVNEILQDFNKTNIDYPEGLNVLDLFKTQVAKTPNKIALSYNDQVYTYQELDDHSNKLAGTLKANFNTCKGDLIGVQLTHSNFAVLSILGIMKTGAAFVPISPDWPSARKSKIVESTEMKVLVTESSYLFETDYFDGTLFAIDLEFDPANCEHTIADEFNFSNDLAYVLYTSGSTGTPKGVMIEHKALANYLNWCLDTYVRSNNLSADMGLFTSMSFDLTMTSLFLPLISGGTIQVMPQKDDVAKTLKSYLASDLSVIKLTPAHISLLGALDLKNTNLKLAIVGGEALLPNHIKILRSINPSIKIYNEYGPTEATVGCVVYEVPENEEKTLIGKPIANTKICMVNENKHLTPIGVVGEIGISGAGLARGYFNQEDLTDEKFISHPFFENERIYMTGDLARWMPDGNIEFVGRTDDQVKVRGYRIELGEIESILNSNKNINNAVVLVKTSANGEKDLVAYYSSEKEINASKLRIYIQQYLPEYMVPTYWVHLPKFNLTVNGKIDRKHLPDPKEMATSNETEYIAPQTKIECELVSIWESILERDRVGVNDNFFSLGGHSIKAVSISSDISRKLNVNMNIADLFKDPTIKKLAIEIENRIEQNSLVKESEIVDKVVI